MNASAQLTMFFIIGAVVMFGVTSGGFLIALRNAKHDRLERIRQYIQKYPSYLLDQIKQILLMRGIKEALRQN